MQTAPSPVKVIPAEKIAPNRLRTEEMVLNVGPQHPSTHGVLRLETVLDGELVVDVIPHLGYLHRCFEKHSEAMTYPQVIPYVDRMDYLAPMNGELGYAIAVERAANIGVLPADVAINGGASGPMLRGSGVKWDLRRDDPYSIYDCFEFDIPVGTGMLGTVGDCFDRHWVRMCEWEQSLNIIE